MIGPVRRNNNNQQGRNAASINGDGLSQERAREVTRIISLPTWPQDTPAMDLVMVATHGNQNQQAQAIFIMNQRSSALFQRSQPPNAYQAFGQQQMQGQVQVPGQQGANPNGQHIGSHPIQGVGMNGNQTNGYGRTTEMPATAQRTTQTMTQQNPQQLQVSNSRDSSRSSSRHSSPTAQAPAQNNRPQSRRNPPSSNRPGRGGERSIPGVD